MTTNPNDVIVRRLAAAVVLQAIRDLNSRDKLQSADAFFFFADVDWCANWLDLAGMRADPIRLLIMPRKERRKIDARRTR